MTRTPAAPDDLKPGWLTKALTAAGILRHGHVKTARWERIGQEFGFTGVIGRVELEYENAVGNPPSSLVAKLPMALDEAVSAYRRNQERDPVLVERYFERCSREERFYREIGVPFAPRLYYSAVDDAERSVVLLLEDVSEGRQGDVLHGCSVDEAALVIEELAPFHARWWGDRAPAAAFPRGATDDPQVRQERYARQAPGFLSRHAGRFPPEVTRLVEQLGSGLAAVVEALHARSQTLIHADLHLDNMIFRPLSVVVFDWQTVMVGSPAWDVAMFLSTSLGVTDRRASEGDLFDRYLSLLGAHGVAGYSVEDLRMECRLALLSLLAGTVHWLASLEPAELTAREHALQAATLNDGRLAAALVDHNVEDQLAALAST